MLCVVIQIKKPYFHLQRHEIRKHILRVHTVRFPLLFGRQQLTWITAEMNPPDIRLSVTLCRDHIDSPVKDEKAGAGQMFLSVSVQ